MEQGSVGRESVTFEERNTNLQRVTLRTQEGLSVDEVAPRFIEGSKKGCGTSGNYHPPRKVRLSCGFPLLLRVSCVKFKGAADSSLHTNKHFGPFFFAGNTPHRIFPLIHDELFARPTDHRSAH